MSKKIFYGIILGILSLSIPKLYAQEIKKYDLPEERVFVQTDKDFYISGESIWFKAFLQSHLENPSPVIYLDITTPQGKVLSHLKLKVKVSAASGAFTIPETWEQGVYHIRAYTPYLMAFGIASFYSQPIPIYNPDQIPTAEETDNTALEVGLYPEGGSLIEGVPNRVVLHVQNPLGEGIAFKGVLIDNSDSTQVHFQSIFYGDSTYRNAPSGLGVFQFVPKEGKSYRVVLTNSKGITKNIALDQAKTQGLALQVNQHLEEIRLDLFGQKILDNGILCEIIHRGKVIKALNILPESTSQGFFHQKISLESAKYPEGLLELRFYNNENQLLAKRIIYNHTPAYAQAELKITQPAVRQREQIKLQILSGATSSGSLQGDFQVFVKRKTLGNILPHQPDLSAYLMYSCSLEYPLENPGFYARHWADSIVFNAFNRLLISQNIKHFEQTATPRLSLESRDQNFVLHTGLTDAQTNLPLQSDMVSRLVLGEKGAFEKPCRDPEGKFEEEVPEFYGKRTFFYFNLHRGSHENNPIKVQYKDRPYDSYPIEVAALRYTPEVKTQLQEASIKKIIAANYQTSAHIPTDSIQEGFSTPKLSEGFKPSQTLILDEYISFPNVTEIIRESLYYLTARPKEGKMRLRITPEDHKGGLYPQKPLFLVDGQPTFDQELILNLAPANLEKIEVYASFQNLRKWGGVIFTSGVVDLKTRQKNIVLTKSDNVIEINGYYPEIKFSPSTQATLLTSRTPDLRDLLHWQTELFSTENPVAFYHSDLLGDFEIIFQGLSKEGFPIQKRLTYTAQSSKGN